MRRGSERCTIGTGRANVVSFARDRSLDRSVFVGLRLVFTRDASSRRRFHPRNVDARSRAVDRTHPPLPRSNPRSNPLPLSPRPDVQISSRITRRLARAPARARAPSRWRTRTRRGCTARVSARTPSPTAWAPQRRSTPSLPARACAPPRALFGSRAATEAGVVFAPNPRGRRLRPHPQIRAPRVSPPTKTRGSLPSPSFPFAPPRGWNTRGGTRGTHLLGAANRSPRCRPGWATTPRGNPTGTRGRTSRRRGRASPGKRVQGLFAPADDLDALHGVTGDDAHGADRRRGGDRGISGGGRDESKSVDPRNIRRASDDARSARGAPRGCSGCPGAAVGRVRAARAGGRGSRGVRGDAPLDPLISGGGVAGDAGETGASGEGSAVGASFGRAKKVPRRNSGGVFSSALPGEGGGNAGGALRDAP